MTIKQPYIADDQTEFGVGIEVSIHQVIDHYDDTCSVSVRLSGDEVKAVRDVGTMTYNDTWEDVDVINHIKTIMKV